MSTVSAVETKLRIRLDETSANEWTDAQLIDYIAEAEQRLARRLGKLRGSGRFRYRESITLTANSETFALSGLTKRFEEFVEPPQLLWNNEYIDCPRMRDGDDAAHRASGTLVPGIIIPAYTLYGEAIKFLPVSSSARTLYVFYRYLPSFKTSGGESLETPQDWDHILILWAAHLANADAGQVNVPFEQEYASFIAEMEEAEQGRAYGTAVETVRPTSTRSLFF